MAYEFPRTTVAGESLSRMIIGTNWIMGFSHTSPSADKMIRGTHHSREAIFPLLNAFLEEGVDTIMGLVGQTPLLYDSIQYAQEKTGRRMNLIDTPILNVADTPEARREAEATIKQSAKAGCRFCFLHHSSVEQLVSKLDHKINRIDDYTKMIRDAGMIPGLSAHMPELILYSDENDYDVQTYIQLYNCMGFLMQVEIETVAAIINSAKKPVMTIKPMAAGRVTPFVGLNFSWNTIRDCDMVTVGCYTPEEVKEDIEISRAALERRFPGLQRRSSPNKQQDAFGH